VEHCGGDDHVWKYVHSTLLFSVVPCFFHLNSVHSLPLLFFHVFSILFIWIVATTAPTSSYSVLSSLCIQRGHFQVEHGGGDGHATKYVHPTTCFCCPLLLSLEFCPLTPVAFFGRFLDFILGLSTTHGTDILLQRSDLLLNSTRTFPSGILRQ
jgi:hypothetical protein